MAIASVIADSDEPRALDVVDLATEDEPAPKVLSSQPEIGLENRRKFEDSVDASECEWEANSWGITMEIAKKCLNFKRDGKRLEAACVEALSDLLEWQPEDVVRQIITILNRL